MTQMSKWALAAAACLLAGSQAYAETGKSLRSVSQQDGSRLVYEYDAPKGGPGRVTIDTNSILRDVDRSQKKSRKKAAPAPQAASAAPMIEQTALNASDVTSAAPIVTPAADRKVRVIPLYNVPKN